MSDQFPALRNHGGLAVWLAGLHDPGPEPMPPQIDDLWTLYATARLSGVVSALEYGSGWSTAVLALALHENKAGYGNHYDGRHPSPFTVHSLEADPRWAEMTIARIPNYLIDRVAVTVCRVAATTVEGRPAHVFEHIPTCLPDLIYVDGPDPGQCSDEVPGQSPDVHGLPMSADLLRIEHLLWPQTVVVVDGRTANARFLASHLRRRWETFHDPYGDRTWLRLAEEPLGPIQRRHIDLRHYAARAVRSGPGGNWGPPV